MGGISIQDCTGHRWGWFLYVFKVQIRLQLPFKLLETDHALRIRPLKYFRRRNVVQQARLWHGWSHDRNVVSIQVVLFHLASSCNCIVFGCLLFYPTFAFPSEHGHEGVIFLFRPGLFLFRRCISSFFQGTFQSIAFAQVPEERVCICTGRLVLRFPRPGSDDRSATANHAFVRSQSHPRTAMSLLLPSKDRTRVLRRRATRSSMAKCGARRRRPFDVCHDLSLSSRVRSTFERERRRVQTRTWSGSKPKRKGSKGKSPADPWTSREYFLLEVVGGVGRPFAQRSTRNARRSVASHATWSWQGASAVGGGRPKTFLPTCAIRRHLGVGLHTARFRIEGTFPTATSTSGTTTRWDPVASVFAKSRCSTASFASHHDIDVSHHAGEKRASRLRRLRLVVFPSAPAGNRTRIASLGN